GSVFDDRTTYGPSEIVEIDVRRQKSSSVHIAPVKGIARIEVGVPVIFVKTSMECIGARLQNYIHNSAARTAPLGSQSVVNQIEFRNSIRRRIDHNGFRPERGIE